VVEELRMSSGSLIEAVADDRDHFGALVAVTRLA